LSYLVEHLQSGEFDGRVFTGVRELLDALRAAGATLGLLTGNVSGGAAIKIEHYGLTGYFEFGAYGDDHHDRNELGPIALARAEATHGRNFAGGQTVVVGDTPRDIACGKAIGALTLCVATGTFSVRELQENGADLVVEEFAAPAEILEALRTVRGES
jgi:phosphoglycolate phosphatase-like HAD superfamily hydrolase